MFLKFYHWRYIGCFFFFFLGVCYKSVNFRSLWKCVLFWLSSVIWRHSGIYWVSIIHKKVLIQGRSVPSRVPLSPTEKPCYSLSIFSYIKLHTLSIFWIISFLIDPQRVYINIILNMLFPHWFLRKLYSAITMFNEKITS